MFAKYCELYVLNICFMLYVLKIAPRQSWRVCLNFASKFALFSGSGLDDEKLIKKQTSGDKF